MTSKSFLAILMTTAIASAVHGNIFNQPTNAQTADNVPEVSNLNYTPPKDQVSFYCSEIKDKETGEAIPATVAYVPQRKADVPIVAWKSQHSAAWNPQKRCEIVSPKFQTFHENGLLYYLSDGVNAGYPVICAILSKNERCNSENQLFQVRPGTDPKNVVLGLEDILDGKSKEPIYQNSGGRAFVYLSGFLENAPTVDTTELEP